MRIAQAIESYLVEYPHAADTAIGVHDWWFPSNRPPGSTSDVEQALDYLAAVDRVSRTVRGDGTVIYGRPVAKPEGLE